MSQYKILAVDDEEDLLEILGFILDEAGLLENAELLMASNGKEALEVIANNEIDCVISDINMPVMNGIELVRTIQANGFTRPVLLLSGHGDPSTLSKVDGLSIYKFLEKPFDTEEIKKVVATILKSF